MFPSVQYALAAFDRLSEAVIAFHSTYASRSASAADPFLQLHTGRPGAAANPGLHSSAGGNGPRSAHRELATLRDKAEICSRFSRMRQGLARIPLLADEPCGPALSLEAYPPRSETGGIRLAMTLADHVVCGCGADPAKLRDDLEARFDLLAGCPAAAGARRFIMKGDASGRVVLAPTPEAALFKSLALDCPGYLRGERDLPADLTVCEIHDDEIRARLARLLACRLPETPDATP